MYSHSNKSDMIQPSEEAIDLVNIFNILKYYKKSIFFIILSTVLISVAYTYFSINKYQSSITLSVQDGFTNSSSQDQFFNQALGQQNSNVDNEMAIIKSYRVVKKAIEHLGLNTRYYLKNGYKNVEIFKGEAPFEVNGTFVRDEGAGYRFEITSVDEAHYSLTMVPSFAMKIKEVLGFSNPPLVSFSKTFTYGSKVIHPWFQLVVNKKDNFNGRAYSFTLASNDEVAGMVLESLTTSLSAEKSSIMILNYEDNLAERAQIVTQSIGEAYLAEEVEVKSSGAAKSIDFIDKQLKEVKAALEVSAKNVEQYKSSHTLFDPKVKGAIASQKLSEYESQLYEINMQENVLNNLLKNLKNNQEMKGIDVSAISMVQNSAVQALIQTLQQAHNSKAALMVDYTDKHPSVIKINQQILNLRGSLVETLETDLEGIRERKNTLNQIIASNKSDLEAIPYEEKELAQLSNEQDVNQKTYEYLLQKRAELALVEASNVSNTRIIDDASVSSAIRSNKLLIILIGFLGGFVIGLIQALLRNFIGNKINLIQDIEGKCISPIFAVLPEFNDKKSLFKDSLRIMLTKLEYHPINGNRPKVINFTSSVAGEGRTTIIVEFATIIAKSGKKVMVLDLNMRMPSLDKKLGLDNSKGMSSYLENHTELDEVLLKTEQGFDVILSGPISEGSYELMMSEKFSLLLDSLKESYDYVLILSPQVGIVADALLLIRMSDLNLFIFRAQYSKRSFVQIIDRFINEHHIDNSGIILNGLELNKIRPWQKKSN